MRGEGINSPSFQYVNVFHNIALVGYIYSVDVRYVVTGSNPLVIVEGSDVSKNTPVIVEDAYIPNPIFIDNLPSSPIAVNSDLSKCSAIVTYNNPIVTDNCSFIEAITDYVFVGRFNGHSYYMSNIALNPVEANKAAFAIGGHLITIENQEENDFIRDNSILKTNVVEGIWIGLNDTLTQGDFKWVTGEPFVFNNWKSSPSGNDGSEDWVEFYINWGNDKIGTHTENGKWNDNASDKLKRYVVEFEGPRFIQTDGLVSGSAFPVGTITNTFEIINNDDSGTGITSSFDVIVEDKENPVLLDLFDDLSLFDCSDNEITQLKKFSVGSLILPETYYSDNCTGTLRIEYKIDAPGSAYDVDFGTDPDGDPSDKYFPEGVSTLYFRVVDASGNLSNEKTYTVTVNHKPNPSEIKF